MSQITDDEKIRALVKQLAERDQTIKELRVALKIIIPMAEAVFFHEAELKAIENARKLLEP
jgi:hypothetical protein